MIPRIGSSATIAFQNFKQAIESVGNSLDDTTMEYVQFTNRLKLMSLQKDEEQDRIMYLKMIQKYSGYKFTFNDFRNA